MDIFCTSIHCMDGRIQEPIRDFLKEHHNATYVDTITEPGPCKILAENTNKRLIDSIVERVEISKRKHKSRLIAISGHHDCAGNPCDETTQKDQVNHAVSYLRTLHPDIKIIGLWIDDEWRCFQINPPGT